MNLVTANFLLAIIATLLTDIVARPETEKIPHNVRKYVDCGGKLENTMAAITYKADTSVSSNERCVWTIRSPTAIGYTLEVLSFGLQATQGLGISATCILPDNIAATHYPIEKAGVVTIPAFCPVLLLTFFSGENVVNSRGFVMIYTEVAGATNISPESKHYDVTTSEGHIRHPGTVAELYSDFELSTFVFAPPNNVYNPDRRVLVTYTADSLPGVLCKDNIRVHRFNPVGGWVHNDRTDYICGDVEYKTWYTADLLLVVFRTDDTDVGRGFHITHTNLP